MLFKMSFADVAAFFSFSVHHSETPFKIHAISRKKRKREIDIKKQQGPNWCGG